MIKNSLKLGALMLPLLMLLQSPAVALSASVAALPPGDDARVVGVVNGDTIEVVIRGIGFTVGYLGISAPRPATAKAMAQCYAPQSYWANYRLVVGQVVRVERETTDFEPNGSGRLMRYVYLSDGRMVNEVMLKNGGATVSTIYSDQRYRGRLAIDQQAAQSGGAGMWGVCQDVLPIVETAADLNQVLPRADQSLDTVFGMEVSVIQAGSTLPLLKSANAGWIRRTAISWREIEPVEGQRNWAALSGIEQEFKLAGEQGFKLVAVVRDAPVWAQAVQGVGCGPIKAEKYRAFGAFMRDLVARYGQSPYNVHYWEIWNEPDIAPQLVPAGSLWGCWGNAKDAYYGGEAYGEMLKVIYPMVKSGRSDAQVMVGGLLLDCDPRQPPAGKDCMPARFLEGVLKAGGNNAFDGVAFHAYDYYDTSRRGVYSNSNWHSSSASTGPVVTEKVTYVSELLSKYGVQGKFLMNTEMALVCGRDGTESRCLTQEYADTKAAYVVEAYAASLAQGLRAAMWYNLSGWRGSGLLDAFGGKTSAYQAYAFASSRLSGASSIMAIVPGQGIQGYEVGKGAGRMWVIWAIDGNRHVLALPEAPRATFDIAGKPIQPGKTMTISSMPVYLDW